MKAEMSEDGVITIRPESSVEAYALRAWGDKYESAMRSGGDLPVFRIDSSWLSRAEIVAGETS